MKRNIAFGELDILVDVKLMVSKMKEVEEELYELAAEITEEEDTSGFTFDFVFNDLTLEELLENLDITVKKGKNAKK
jgi:hypothetical protein